MLAGDVILVIYNNEGNSVEMFKATFSYKLMSVTQIVLA